MENRPAACWPSLWMACLMLAATSALAQAQSTEYKVKAVYLVKFLQFVDWPSTLFADKTSPLVIGVLGNDPFGKVLDEAVEGEMINDHPVVVRRMANPKEMAQAQVLYIGKSEKVRVHSILAELKGQSILTVSDIESFCYDGGIVRFLVVNNKVHFRINVDAARDANLQISSKLLQLAEIVHSPGIK